MAFDVLCKMKGNHFQALMIFAVIFLVLWIKVISPIKERSLVHDKITAIRDINLEVLDYRMGNGKQYPEQYPENLDFIFSPPKSEFQKRISKESWFNDIKYQKPTEDNSDTQYIYLLLPIAKGVCIARDNHQIETITKTD